MGPLYFSGTGVIKLHILSIFINQKDEDT